MEINKDQFIHYSMKKGVISFGEFETKSKRISPYFFNSGLFNTGDSIRDLGKFCARAILHSNLKVHGIPVVSIANFDDLLSVLVSSSFKRNDRDYQHLFNTLKSYIEKYGVHQ